jgi:cytochrome c oxidase assembly protein subunit 11
MDRTERQGRRIRLTATVLAAVAVGMTGLSFASAPLYRLFCQVTGFAGTPNTQNVGQPAAVSDKAVTVRFDANVNSALPWRFKPVQHQVDVRLGQEVLVYYTAKNTSDRPLTGTATFNVTPFKAAPYFTKLECFCFTEQTLQPGEEVQMPVLFYVDPALAESEEASDVHKITLSYTFFRVDGKDDAGAAARVSARLPGDTDG